MNWREMKKGLYSRKPYTDKPRARRRKKPKPKRKRRPAVAAPWEVDDLADERLVQRSFFFGNNGESAK